MDSSSRGDYSKFTFRIDEKDYKDAIPEHFSTPEFGATTTKRYIGVKFIPKGTMMFHSYKQEEALKGETVEQTVNRNFANFLQRYCLHTCEYEKDSDSFKICFTTEGNKSKFFFPGPCAGFGLMYAENYNTTMMCLTKRDMYVAYLKSGYYPDDTLIPHRKIPFSSGDLINFDGDRLVVCDRLNSNNSCITTDNTDPCLKKQYILEGKIDGYTTVAIPDSIAAVRDDGSITTSYKKKDLVLFTFLQNLLKRVAEEGDAEKKQLLLNLYNTLLLLLETDTKTGFVSAGIAEYALQPFGHMSSDSNYLPLVTHETQGLFDIIEESGAKKVVRVKRQNMKKFIQDFVEPYTILQPLKLFTTSGSFDISQQNRNFDVSQQNRNFDVSQRNGNNANKKNNTLLNTLTNFLGTYAPLTEDQKYRISADIAKYLFKDLGGFLWEPRSNVFVVENSVVANRSEKTSLKFVVKDTKTIKPVTIGFNDFRLGENVAENVYAYFYKILNLLVTNMYWNLDTFYKKRLEVFKIALPGAQEAMSVLEGPFFQPFHTKKVLKYENILNTFASLHSLIERNTGIQSEYTKLIKTNYTYFKTITQHFLNTKKGLNNYGTITGGYVNMKKLNTAKIRRNNKNKNRTLRNRMNTSEKMLEEEERGGRSSMNVVPHSKESLQGLSSMMKLPAMKSLFVKLPPVKANSPRKINTNMYAMYTGSV
jgi:hypothetical protein